jgi:hypothetical protein
MSEPDRTKLPIHVQALKGALADAQQKMAESGA